MPELTEEVLGAAPKRERQWDGRVSFRLPHSATGRLGKMADAEDDWSIHDLARDACLRGLDAAENAHLKRLRKRKGAAN